MLRSTRNSVIFCLSACIILFSGCNGEVKQSGTPEMLQNAIVPEEESFSATRQENTASVPASVLNDLESYNAETGEYVFAGGASEVKALQPGSVVMFEGHSLRKVKAVTKEGGRVILNTEFAKLTDFYKDAQISYSQKVDWGSGSMADAKLNVGEPQVTMAGMPMLAALGGGGDGESDGGVTTSGGEGSLKVELKREINGWKVKFKLQPESGSKLNISLSAEKQRICKIEASGFISDFTSTATIDIADGETQEFSYHNNGVEGEIELKFTAVGLGSEIAILEIPASIERTILVHGVIPVTLRLKANLKIIPEIAVGESSQASMKLRYNSNTGFSYQGASLTANAEVTGDNAEQTGDCNTATTGIAGMGVGIEFPRFEVGIFGNLVVPYMVLKTHASSYLSTGLLGGALPCHLARLKYDVNVGVSMAFLNVASINYNYKAFEQEKSWTTDDSRCDE